MRKAALVSAISLLLTFTSFFLNTESKAAQRACTGKEVAQIWNYKALIEIEQFYSKLTSNAAISGYQAKMNLIYDACDTSKFNVGNTSPKAPVCTSSDNNWLINIRTAYLTSGERITQLNTNIEEQRKILQNYAVKNLETVHAKAMIEIQNLTKEIQHHGTLRAFYQQEFNSVRTDCKNSSVTWPSEAPASSQSKDSTNLADYPERYMGYRTGDVAPLALNGLSCGPNASHTVSVDTLDSSNKWQRTELDWSGKFDLGGKYALQVMTIPVDSFRTNIGNGNWRGIKWPYETQRAFAIERCDFANRGSHANKSYDLSVFGTAKGSWNRQQVDNLVPFSYQTLSFNYRIDSVGQEDFSDPKWECALKKPTVVTTKKNGKSVKTVTPPVSDFKVNVSSDGTSLSIWECDDIKLGKFTKVQTILISNGWDTTEKTGKGETLWEVAKLDPKHPNWTWACPTGTGPRNCHGISGLN
jgi:hypothetical protein